MAHLPTAVLLAALALPARAHPPRAAAAFAADLAAEIDRSNAAARTAMRDLKKLRCAGIAPDLAECRRSVERFLKALDTLTAILEGVETRTKALVFEDALERMGAEDRLMLDGRFQALILAVPFPPELARLLVPDDMAARAQEAVERYYFVADGIWNPAVFAFGDHLMTLIARRGQGLSAPPKD